MPDIGGDRLPTASILDCASYIRGSRRVFLVLAAMTLTSCSRLATVLYRCILLTNSPDVQFLVEPGIWLRVDQEQCVI